MICLDNFFTGTQGQHRAPAGQPALRADAPRRDRSRSMSRSTRSTTSPARPRRSTTSTTRCRRPRPPCMGAINMLGLAKRVRREVLQASTSEVYGDPDVHPQPESYWGNVNPIGPRACYDEGKRCAETLFFDYHRQHRVRHPRRPHLQHLRPAHAPERRPRGVATSSSRRCAASPSPSTATAPRPRSFCYVDDLIEGFIRLMDGAGRAHRPGQPRQSRRVHHAASWPSW